MFRGIWTTVGICCLLCSIQLFHDGAGEQALLSTKEKAEIYLRLIAFVSDFTHCHKSCTKICYMSKIVWKARHNTVTKYECLDGKEEFCINKAVYKYLFIVVFAHFMVSWTFTVHSPYLSNCGRSVAYTAFMWLPPRQSGTVLEDNPSPSVFLCTQNWGCAWAVFEWSLVATVIFFLMHLP